MPPTNTLAFHAGKSVGDASSSNMVLVDSHLVFVAEGRGSDAAELPVAHPLCHACLMSSAALGSLQKFLKDLCSHSKDARAACRV